MNHVPSRVGVLDRGTYRIRSVRRLQGVASLEAMGLTVEEVRTWMKEEEGAVEDNSYLAFFYRCLEEGSEFYYLYDLSSTDGWRCGGTTWDTPILGRLVPYEEARVAVEDWSEDLKWQVSRGE